MKNNNNNNNILAIIKQNHKWFKSKNRDYFEEITAKINTEVKLSEVLTDFGFDLKKAYKKELKCSCPFHQEKTASLHINDEKNLYHCFGCKASGNLFTFISEYHGKQGNDMIEFFAEKYNINIDLRDNMPTQKTTTTRTKKAPKKALKPIPLPHFNLATFPDSYKIDRPNVIESKAVGTELKKMGVYALRKTYYIYRNSPKTYRIRTEALDREGNRLPVLGDNQDKLKDFHWEHIDRFDMPHRGIPISPDAPPSGQGSQAKIEIDPYRFPEAVLFGKGKIVILVEGEKDSETLRKVGLVAISFNYGIESLKKLKCDGFLIIGDNDEGGNAQLSKVCDFCINNEIPFKSLSIKDLWVNAPQKADITDFYTTFCIDEFEGTPGDEANQAFSEMIQDLIAPIDRKPSFKVGDFIAHCKSPNNKLEILEITDNYQDGDNGILSGYYVKGFGFDKTPHFIAESVVIPYVESELDREKREQEEAFTRAIAALEVIDLVVEAVDDDDDPAFEEYIVKEDAETEAEQEAIAVPDSEIVELEEASPPTNSIRGIIFNKIAREPLGKGKTVTRREWTAKTAQIYIDYYHQGILIPALSGSLSRSGVELGKLRLTKEPYQQPLSEMTQEDLIKEGFPSWTLENFYHQFFNGDNAKNVWVLEFEYFPNDQKQKFDDLQDRYRGMTSEQRDEIYTEIALNELFTDEINPYRAIDGELYQWTGTHYEKCKEALEKNRISRWLVNFSPALALKEKVNQVWEWAIYNLPVDLDEINPGGINVLNGVLKVNFDSNGKGTVSLERHDPRNIYTYCAPIKYDPDIDPSHYEKLMDCLDAPQRKIFIRTMATAFDLPYFKSKNGRPRALLLNGTGSNGKDALGKSIKAIFGHSIANASLGDFRDYDSNRKFPLAKLDGSMVSWSSENVGNANIEDIQSLKAAISGETLSYELKGGNERPFEPRCVFVFNCNKPPAFKSDIEAIKTRWAILNFTKTFKTHPNKKNGECQADPRFNDDLEFIHNHLAPAMLNDMIAQLSDLAIDGIDYSPVTQNLEAIQRQSSHLFQFCEDVGIVQNSQGFIWVSDLWDLLRQWYIDNGVLEVIPMEKGKVKEVWNDQPVKGDQNVKASNQVVKRFVTLFPKISRCVETKPGLDKNRVYLRGIEKLPYLTSLEHESSDTALPDDLPGKAIGKATTLDTVASKSSKAISPILLAENLKCQSYAEKIKFVSSIFSDQELKMLGLSTALLTENIDTCYNILPPTITDTLRSCLKTGNPESLKDVRSEYPAELLKLAAQPLSKDEKLTLKKWIGILDNAFKVGDRIVKTSDSNHVFVIERIEGANLHCRSDKLYGEKELLNVSFVQKIEG